MGSKGQNPNLSEPGHVAYHIKESEEYSNMVANSLPADPPLPPPPDLRDWVNRSNFNFFTVISNKGESQNAATW